MAQPTRLLTSDVTFDQLPNHLGLAQNSINCMLQDRDGYLWIGTWSGLIRYDGYSTVLYHSSVQAGKIKSDKITAIYEDHNGVLWIGTLMAGLFQLNKQSGAFVQYKHNSTDQHSLSNNNVWCIQEDNNNKLWIGTDHGLNLYNSVTNKFTSFFTVPDQLTSLSNNHITTMCLTSANALWIGTTDGLNKLVPQLGNNFTFERHYYTQGHASQHAVDNYIFGLSEMNNEGKSSLWFCTGRGLKKYEDGIFTNYLLNGKPSSFNAFLSLKVIEGKEPFVVVGSEKGLCIFEPSASKFSRTFSGVDPSLNLSNGSVTSLYLDGTGILWAGTKKGINKYDCFGKSFEAYKTSSFDKSQGIITGIQGAGKDAYFLSTLGGGLYRFAKKNFTHIRFEDTLDNDLINYIQTLYTSPDGTVYLGTAGSGIYQFRQNDINKSGIVKHFLHYNSHSKPAISSDYIMSLLRDTQGNVWAGTWQDGLNKITPDNKVIIYKNPLLLMAPLVVIYEDKSANLWIGTRGNGLYRITPDNGKLKIKTWQSSDQKYHGLTNDFINSICQDKYGMLWLGTEEGLFRFDAAKEKFLFQPGNAQSAITGIATVQSDDKGRLWLAQQNGLTVIDPQDPTYIKKYDYHDHIQGGFFYNNVGHQDADGNLFFGGSEGFNIIKPAMVAESPSQPRVTINSVKLFGKQISYSKSLSDNVSTHVKMDRTRNLIFKAKENSLSFDFSAMDYAAPEKIRYAYKLEGFDAGWKYINSLQRNAVYTNLSDGSYVFNVKATNTDGMWSKHITKIHFVIIPPWYKTPWAFMLYILSGLMALYVFRRIIILQANLKHNLKLERMQRENMEKLNQVKLQFFTNISHEFRTPLTLILGPVQSLMDARQLEKKEREQLLIISSNANRLLRLVNQLLDFRKVESGNTRLEVSQRNVVKFVREIKFSFEALAEMLNIDFYFVANSNIIQLWFDADQLEKVMFNLLSNAFKHTPAGGKITVSIKELGEHVSICVEDNGKGIKLQHFDKIFETFFSYDEDKHHTGTGIGLAFAKSLVEMHHGTLDFESDANVSTKFTVSLKKGFAHFDGSEISALSFELESYDNGQPNDPLAGEIPDALAGISAEMGPLRQLPKVLIVEDNFEMKEYLKNIFHEYDMLLASNGKEGLDIANEKMPQVIISDVMMPVMDGIKLCALIKSNVKTSHIPVLLLTARTSLEYKLEGLETGADDYIQKPFNPNLLKLKVRNLIQSREAMQNMFQDSNLLNIEPKKVTLTTTDETFVKNALEGIEKNMSNPQYGVDDLGRDVGMSRTQLYRKLKALTGQSANEFIRTLRLKRAAQLLEQYQLTIAEVTHRVGFTDLQYFRDCFKNLFGSTPSEYVQNMRKKQTRNST